MSTRPTQLNSGEAEEGRRQVGVVVDVSLLSLLRLGWLIHRLARVVVSASPFLYIMENADRWERCSFPVSLPLAFGPDILLSQYSRQAGAPIFLNYYPKF